MKIIDLDFSRDIVRREAEAVASLAENMGENFENACQRIYSCRGSIVLSGIGKAGIIAQKISATLASTGTPSHFLHAAEAVHGDLGRLRTEDIVVLLSAIILLFRPGPKPIRVFDESVH